MIIGSIYGWENGEDDIFDPHSSRNRDDCLEPMRVMEAMSRQRGVELHTADVNQHNLVEPDFSLYVESVDFVPCPAKKNYLILYETPLTVPRNADYYYLNQFDSIFTWSKQLLKGGLQDKNGNSIASNRFFQIKHPNPIPKDCREVFHSPVFDERVDFACLIGSNRYANLFDERELYSERVKAIKWFEEYAPCDFKLYGNGWKVPQKRLGQLGKLRYRMEKIIPWIAGRPVFPSYQGQVNTKYEVLSRTKFCICFENARDIDGYVTEKIFDCLFAGCIPIYWGDANIGQSIPSACFIDFRQFQSYHDLYRYLTTITSEQFFRYQEAARNFLKSAQFTPFSSQSFAGEIIHKITEDFGLASTPV